MLSQVQTEAASRFASLGRPWEFNLRDVMCWCCLIKEWQLPGEYDPLAFVHLLYTLRLRSEADRNHILNKILPNHFPGAAADLAARAR